MNKQEYNGWTNYETWVVSLWMDNEKGTYDYWRERAREILADSKPTQYSTGPEMAKAALADTLKIEHEEGLPDLNGFAADLLNAAMSEVNWYEIAEHLIQDVKENAA